jgi:hypothetical protein
MDRSSRLPQEGVPSGTLTMRAHFPHEKFFLGYYIGYFCVPLTYCRQKAKKKKKKILYFCQNQGHHSNIFLKFLMSCCALVVLFSQLPPKNRRIIKIVFERPIYFYIKPQCGSYLIFYCIKIRYFFVYFAFP